jgi:hypothetical protein
MYSADSDETLISMNGVRGVRAIPRFQHAVSERCRNDASKLEYTTSPPPQDNAGSQSRSKSLGKWDSVLSVDSYDDSDEDMGLETNSAV